MNQHIEALKAERDKLKVVIKATRDSKSQNETAKAHALAVEEGKLKTIELELSQHEDSN